MKKLKMLSVLCLNLVFLGCATIISGRNQLITVNANVEGAEVTFNGQFLGRTPLSTQLPRGQQGALRVEAEGYQPNQVALQKRVNSVFFVNVFTGGTFGSSTDYSTGAMYEYEPSTFFVSLQPLQQTDEEQDSWESRERLRGFVLLNHQAIVTELAAGKGEYLDVLFQGISIAEESRDQAIESWRRAYPSSDTVLDFADALLSWLK